MPAIPLVSGGSQPVFATDVLNGPQLASNQTYTPAGTPVNFMGPKLEFYGVDLGADPSGQAGVNGAIQQVLQAIQQETTVAMYQVDATAAATNFSVAVFPAGAYGDASVSANVMQAQIRALGNIQITNAGVTTGYDVAGATVTNVGFRLATTATSAS
jgi:hypothetical protein